MSHKDRDVSSCTSRGIGIVNRSGVCQEVCGIAPSTKCRITNPSHCMLMIQTFVHLADEDDRACSVSDHLFGIRVEQCCICDQSFVTHVAQTPMITALCTVYFLIMVYCAKWHGDVTAPSSSVRDTECRPAHHVLMCCRRVCVIVERGTGNVWKQHQRSTYSRSARTGVARWSSPGSPGNSRRLALVTESRRTRGIDATVPLSDAKVVMFFADATSSKAITVARGHTST